MKNRTKIIIILIVLGIAGFTIYNKNKKDDAPKIQIEGTDPTTKTVSFKMSAGDKKFSTSVKLGGIRRQVLGDYTFEAITQGKNIVLAIKDKANKVLTTKTITFA